MPQLHNKKSIFDSFLAINICLFFSLVDFIPIRTYQYTTDNTCLSALSVDCGYPSR